MLKRKNAIEIGFVALAALALWFVFFRTRGASAPAATVGTSGNTTIQPGRAFGSEYYIYNYPQVEGPQASDMPLGNPSQTTNNALPTCGCAGGSGGEFPSVAKFADYLQSNLTGFVKNYEDNVLSTVPSWFGQYLNNSSGNALSQAAGTFFSG